LFKNSIKHVEDNPSTINDHQRTPKNIKEHQRTSKNIKEHQRASNNIKKTSTIKDNNMCFRQCLNNQGQLKNGQGNIKHCLKHMLLSLMVDVFLMLFDAL
jgi:hypothetical protein